MEMQASSAPAARAFPTIRSHGVRVLRSHAYDWLALLLLVVVEVVLNAIEPFHRFVGAGMMTDLSYPMKSNTVPVWAVPIIAVIGPMLIFTAGYIQRRNVYDLHNAVLGILFSVLITAVLTDAIKDAVGRPRPDFFWRCFPDGIATMTNTMMHEQGPRVYLSIVGVAIPTTTSCNTMEYYPAYDNVTTGVICHGNASVIKEGHKSFPSGHTSWSFAGLGFLSWYLAGKITVFDRQGHIAKLCFVIMPLLVAAMVAISRVDDYWHHWQDVCTGGILGMVVASVCYLQFFPPPSGEKGFWPHAHFRYITESEEANRTQCTAGMSNTDSTAIVACQDHTTANTSRTLDEMESGT